MLSTVAPSADGIYALDVSGNLVHYQDNGGWSATGGQGMDAIAVTRDPLGHEEVFGHEKDNNVWALDNDQWHYVGANIASMASSSDGIYALDAYGNLVHYQDNGGWSASGGKGMDSLTVSRDPSGREEVFGHEKDNNVWALDNGQWHYVGANISDMAPAADGIYALDVSGNLVHYQDDGGWSATGGQGMDALTVTRDPLGHEEVFGHEKDDNIWALDNGQWHYVGANIASMAPSADGIYALDVSGSLVHYQDDGGWWATGGKGMDSLTVTRDPVGHEEVFGHERDNNVWVLDNGQWHYVGANISGPSASAMTSATATAVIPTNLQVSQSTGGPNSISPTSHTVTVTGTAAPNERIMVMINSNALNPEMSAADSSGNFSFRWSNVPTGAYEVHAVGEGADGALIGQTPDVTFTVADPPPPNPTLQLAPADDSDVRNGDDSGADLTNGTTVHLTGTAAPGEQVMIGYGGPFGTATQPVFAGANGKFSVTLSNLSIIGFAQHYWAHAIGYLGSTPFANNAVTSSWSPNVYFDVAEPPTPTIAMDPSDDTGIRNGDSSGADLTTSTTIVFHGTAAPGELVLVGGSGPAGALAGGSSQADASGHFNFTFVLPVIAFNQHYFVNARGIVGDGTLTSGIAPNVYFSTAPPPSSTGGNGLGLAGGNPPSSGPLILKGHLQYQGGRLLTSPTIQSIFLGPEWNAGALSLVDTPAQQRMSDVNSALRDMVTGPYMAMLSKSFSIQPPTASTPPVNWYDPTTWFPSVQIPGTGGYPITQGRVQGGGETVDSIPGVPALKSGSVITDDQVVSMLNAQLAQGHLTPPGSGQAHDMLYYVFLPPGVDCLHWNGQVSSDGKKVLQLVGDGGYHGSFVATNGQRAFYAVVGYSSTLARQTIVASHELAEAVTDPLVQVAGAQLGWYDNADNEEVGDLYQNRTDSGVVEGQWVVQRLVDPHNNVISPAGSVSYTGPLSLTDDPGSSIVAPVD